VGKQEMKNQVTKIIGIGTSENSKDVFTVSTEIFNVLKDSKSLYPEFFSWYFGKFVPGLTDGSRNIIVNYIDGDIVAVALVKNDGMEKKICTVKVNEKYRNVGVGIRLFGKCLEFLDTTKPMITVSAERLSSFSAILKYYGFKLEQIQKGYYKKNSDEYVFNGSLAPAKKPRISDIPISVGGRCPHFASASCRQRIVCSHVGMTSYPNLVP